MQCELHQDVRLQGYLEKILLLSGFRGEISSSRPGMGEAGIHLDNTRYSTVQLWELWDFHWSSSIVNNTVNSGQRSSVQGTLQYTAQYNTEYSPVQHLGLAPSPFLGESKCRGAGGLAQYVKNRKDSCELPKCRASKKKRARQYPAWLSFNQSGRLAGGVCVL